MENSNRPVTIGIVDGQQLVRESLSALIDSDPTLRLVASAADCETAIAMVGDTPPAVVLVDAELVGCGAFSSIEKLRSAWSTVGVILLLTYVRDNVIEQARSSRIEGVVTRMEPFKELRRAVTTVSIGGHAYSPLVQARFVPPHRRGWQPPATEGHPPRITARELDVLRCMANGRTVKQAARELGLSPATVDNHKTRLMSRLDVHTGAQLVRYAIREGIIEP